MLTLYHNAASTCSQKVRLVLAEKALDYASKPIDLIGGDQHDADYVRMNPNHVVPTLVHDGRVLIESSLINEYLDEAFPDAPLRPEDPAGRHAMRLWVKRIDEIHPNASVMTFGIGTRPLLLQRDAKDREASIQAIPDEARRAERRSVIEEGIAAPSMKRAIHAFAKMLDQMESDLEKDGFLVGDSFSLADAAVLPYVMRLDHLSMTPMIEARPMAMAWYERIRARKSFEIAIDGELPAFVIDMFRKNGADAWGEVERLLA